MNLEINEKWSAVKGYESIYVVSTLGNVKGIDRMVISKKGVSKKKGKVIKTRINNDGYVEVRLSKNGKTTTTFIHILIAKAFIPNSLNKSEVNHINGIKTDNRIENLEWVSHSENMKHAYNIGLIKPYSKHVIDNCTGKEYSSVKEAAKDLNINYGTFRNYLNGNIKNKTCLEYAA